MSSDALFNDTIKQLLSAAKKDGIITPEEMDIIEQVKIDAESYSLMLQEALSDGKLSKKEREKLNELKQMIVDRAELIAKLDGKFDDDEKELLKKLSEIISKRYT